MPLLLFDVGPDGFEGSTSAADNAVAWRPKGLPPQGFLYFVEVFGPNPSCADALEGVDELGQSDLGRIVDKQVYVVVLKAELR